MSSISKLCFVLRHLNKSLNRQLVFNRLMRQTNSTSVIFRQFSDQNNLDKNSETTKGWTDSSPAKDIETIFVLPKVQTLLKRLIGFDEKKVFEMKPTLTEKTNEYRFMTDNELNLFLEMSRKAAEEKLSMPPVLSPKEDKPNILSKDFEIQGYIDSKFIFVDSSQGYSDQTRLIVVRETNGVLREANREERYRMNQMFFPLEERIMERPKMFEEPNLTAVLDRHEYEFVLDRACLQFEPNDPKYIDICRTVFEHIMDSNRFDSLLSTRHFGPLSFYFAFNKRIDNLLNYFILNEAISEASDLCQLFYVIHSNNSELLSDIESELFDDSIDLVKKYISEESKEKAILELSLQKYEEIQREKSSVNEDYNRLHGLKS